MPYACGVYAYQRQANITLIRHIHLAEGDC